MPSDPEVYLFLVHVYYHELSNLYDTPLSRRAASGPTTPDLLRHFLLTLIRPGAEPADGGVHQIFSPDRKTRTLLLVPAVIMTN